MHFIFFRYTAEIGLWQIFQLSIFVPEKCRYQSHWTRNFLFFYSYFGFLPLLGKFERHCRQAIWIFFSFLAAIMRNNFVKRPWIENGKGFAVHSSTWPSGAKGERRVSSWLAKPKTRKNYIVFFYVCCYSFSQSWKSLCNTAVYMIKNFWTQGTFVAILSRIAHLKSWRGTGTWHPKEWLWGKGDLTTQSKSVAGTFSFLNVLIEEDSEMCKYINYVNWRLALHWKRFAALGETLAYGKYPLACWQLSNIIGSKQILLKVHFIFLYGCLHTRFSWKTNDSWQCSQLIFLQEHSNDSWTIMSSLVSLSVHPEFEHCTSFNRHSDWCFYKCKRQSFYRYFIIGNK